MLGSFSTVGEKGTTAVPGGSPTLVPMPGLLAAPKPVPVFELLPKRPPLVPLPNVDVPVPKPDVAGLEPPKSDDPPPKGVLVVFEEPKPPKPVPPAVVVVDPNNPVPELVVVGVPKAGLLPKPPEPKPPVFEPNPPPLPNRPPPLVPVLDPEPKPPVPEPKPVSEVSSVSTRS